MNLLLLLKAMVSRGISDNLDLIGAWVALLILQHHVPLTHWLASEDLIPWMAVTLSTVALLRGQSLGDGFHPMLASQRSTFGAITQRTAMALCPWLIYFIYDLAYAPTLEKQLGLVVALIGFVIAESLATAEGRTSWSPKPSRPWIAWTLGSLGFALSAAALGAGRQLIESTALNVLFSALILGLSFLAMGLSAGSWQHLQQRNHAGKRDGGDWNMGLFSYILAFFGPSVGLFIVWMLLPQNDFGFAFLTSLLIIVWSGIIWPNSEPVAVPCMLHEVIPASGAESKSEGIALPFHLPPQGALRFQPLQIQRTMMTHTWVVPVKSSRIADLDDPVAPLWSVPAPPKGFHTLGDAAFEPNPLTKHTQWDSLTLRLKSSADEKMSAGGKSQRIVILRAFPQQGLFRTLSPRTYHWESRLPNNSVQVLDSTTEIATLINGDIILITSEGVAHAYEFEVGRPMFFIPSIFGARTPQAEDYTEVS